MGEKIRNKKVEESITETTKLLQYKEINGQNRLFGGRLICVHVDNDGRPIPVKYGLEVETLSEKAEWEGAVRRNAARKQRFSDGY
ncbi:MAG: hypothetical protein K2J47_05905 [Ruminococcus sp.]|nr:hypothetical protein [Ruminococcus sp.]